MATFHHHCDPSAKPPVEDSLRSPLPTERLKTFHQRYSLAQRRAQVAHVATGRYPIVIEMHSASSRVSANNKQMYKIVVAGSDPMIRVIHQICEHAQWTTPPTFFVCDYRESSLKDPSGSPTCDEERNGNKVSHVLVPLTQTVSRIHERYSDEDGILYLVWQELDVFG